MYQVREELEGTIVGHSSSNLIVSGVSVDVALNSITFIIS